MSEYEKAPESEQKIAYWKNILQAEGTLSILSTFPKGEHTLGGSQIKSEGEEKGFRIYSISSASSRPKTTPNQTAMIQSEIIRNTIPDIANHRPENTDQICISDLRETRGITNPEITEGTIGVLISSVKATETKSAVFCIMILPQNHLKDLVRDIQDNPTLIRNLTNKLMPELETLVPRQKAESTKLVVNVKTPKKLFPTKINETFRSV